MRTVSLDELRDLEMLAQDEYDDWLTPARPRLGVRSSEWSPAVPSENDPGWGEARPSELDLVKARRQRGDALERARRAAVERSKSDVTKTRILREHRDRMTVREAKRKAEEAARLSRAWHRQQVITWAGSARTLPPALALPTPAPRLSPRALVKQLMAQMEEEDDAQIQRAVRRRIYSKNA